ncbi:MAG: restriction endonuclease subunit S, partial [Candidatus Thermoplasmatota archaeon]|nr:restriction endonuclease subunit S [Candidatus Thermoplasmatota archaeon]
MGDEWRMLSLQDAGVSLIDCDHRTPPASKQGYPYVAIPQIKNGQINLKDVRYISQEHFIDWTRKATPKPFDVVLSRRCNPGETAYVPPGLNFALGQNLVLLRADGRYVFPQFLRWLVRGPDWWEQIGTFINVGAVFDSLKCADIPQFQLLIPPLPEQRAIAHVLGTLDDKIELNRRTNETLEAMARALFKSWFVDFEPVRAKAEGRETGLPIEIDELFPDSFEESELGVVPKGWKITELGDVVDIVKGTSYSSDDLQPSSTALVTLKSFERGGGYRTDGLKEYIGKFKPEQKISPGDVVISFTDVTQAAEVIGRPAIVSPTYEYTTLVASLDVGIVKVKSPEFSKIFLYNLLSTQQFNDHVLSYVNGTTVLHLDKKGIPSYQFVCPPEELLSLYSTSTQSIYKKIVRCDIDSRTLASIRDALLPKLLSGEVRIPGVEG